MLIQHYNDEIWVPIRYHVVCTIIRVWMCRDGPHKFGTIKKTGHIGHFGAVLHNPDTPAYRSFPVSRSKCIGTVALTKYSSQSVKICTLVTDRRHKLVTCSTVTPPTEMQSIQQDLYNALGFRSLIGSQCECKHWHISAFQCAFLPPKSRWQK